MRLLLFVARVAFICNLFFVVCLLMRHTHFTVPAAMQEFVIITGWIMAIIVSGLFTVVLAVLALRKTPAVVPLWLKLINVAAFFFQVIYFTTYNG